MAVFAKAWVKGMTITNVVSCFNSVGVYPLDRRVALTPIAQESEISQQNTPTPFVLFCTPQKGVANATPPSALPTDATTQPATFTAAEVEHFQACLQESKDSRYALWLQTFYPKQNATQGQGIMEAFLQPPNTTSTAKGMHVTTHKVHACSLVSSALWLWRRRLR